MRKAGGAGPRAKLGILAALANWLRVLVPELRAADAVHLRTPCNVSILAIVLARLLVPNRYAIYAGSWHAYEGEALSYRLQRGLLRRFFGGVVQYLLRRKRSTPNMRIAFSPVLTAEAPAALDDRRQRRSAHGSDHGDLRVVCVGRFSANKRPDRPRRGHPSNSGRRRRCLMPVHRRRRAVRLVVTAAEARERRVRHARHQR
jgi:hypothetical protein